MGVYACALWLEHNVNCGNLLLYNERVKGNAIHIGDKGLSES